LINILTNKLNQFLFDIHLLLMMIKYNSQSAKIQDKELLTGLGSNIANNSCEQKFLECSYNELKQLFDTST